MSASLVWRGARTSSHEERGHDLYQSPPCAVAALIRTGEIDRLLTRTPTGQIWEPAAGKGAIVREITAAGYHVAASDLVAYPGADSGIQAPIDFLTTTTAPAGTTLILTNPPYRLADDFVRHGLKLGLPIIVLLPLTKLEGSGRSDIVDRHLHRVWLGVERLPMMHRDGWQGQRTKSGGVPFTWCVFAPGERQGPIALSRISWRAGAETELRPDVRPHVRPVHGNNAENGIFLSQATRKIANVHS